MVVGRYGQAKQGARHRAVESAAKPLSSCRRTKQLGSGEELTELVAGLTYTCAPPATVR